jgi:hypothetical protein
MATVITAGNATNGLTFTTDNTGSLDIKTGTGAGTTALSLTSSQIATFAAATSVAGNLSFNSGYGSSAVAYGCRAWVNFNGTGTVAIRASGNVSSITDNGTGDYTLNFTTAMSDANYSVSFSGIPVNSPSDTRSVTTTIYGAYNTGPTTMTTSQLRIQTSGSAITQPLDVHTICIAIFR